MPLLPKLPLLAATLTLLALILAAVSLNATLTPTAQAQTTTTATDYDSNDDGLIEVSNLAQLNAIRWDLNGDGVVAAADQANYTAAFPNAAAGMGCPDGSDADTNPDPCIGYELKADLTFDSNGDGSVTAADSGGLYWNGGAGWTPLGNIRHGAFTGEFQGRGQVISHLFINNSTRVYLGLFGSIGDGGRVSGLGLEQVSISSTATPSAGGIAGSNTGSITASYARGTISSNASASGNALTGGLVGYNGLAGTVQASFAEVAVSNRNSQPSAIAGGLVGQNAGSIQSSYASGAVSVHGTSQFTRAGGLVGSNGGGITASYARGRVTAAGSGSVAGGLVGRQASNGRATNSYWDTTTSGLSSSAGGTGQSSSALQTPSAYAGIYAHWNLNLDSTAGGDNPWYFGAANQYPVPVYGTARDYDADNDRLLEVENLAQLNAIRWDLNGDGVVAAADQANYAAAFPWPAAGMGCPDGSDADNNPDPCIGYELNADLTFDSNGDGSVTAADSGGLYWNGGAGWTPLGNSADDYHGEFQGRGKVISHLFINNSTRTYLGLFGSIGDRGRVTGLGLEQVSISTTATPSAGGLAGSNTGVITASYARGTISSNVSAGNALTGGLVGYNGLAGTVQASFANVTVSSRHSQASAIAGGLVGENAGNIQASHAAGAVSVHGTTRFTRVGGLAGSNRGQITASYARGQVTRSGSGSVAGGLVGSQLRNGRVTNSYWDTTTSGLASSAGGTGQSSSALQTPTGYTGIYANWNLNLDGVAGGDSPWYFGAANQYPVPVYEMARDYDADNDRLLEVDNLAQLNAIRWDLNGDGVVAAADSANYAAAFPWPAAGMGCADGATAAACIGYELQTDLDFDTNGNGSIDAADQFWNNGQGWRAIKGGPYTAPPRNQSEWDARYFSGTFQGNGKTISNLYINHTRLVRASLSLFETIGTTGVIDGVNLRNVDIRIHSLGVGSPLASLNWGTIRGSSATGRISVNLVNPGTIVRLSDNTKARVWASVGGLVHGNHGSITSSYANTEITGNVSWAGGLVGSNGCVLLTSGEYCGSVVASYSSGAVSSTNSKGATLGGLLGDNTGTITASYSISPVKATGNGARVGGLVGDQHRGTITASYAAGPVVATGTNALVGGLVARVYANTGGTAVNSYWDIQVSGQSSSALGTGKTTAELTDPTGYSGIYANWNLNLDGQTGNDDPWDFTHRYPNLKYGGLSLLNQARIYPDYDGSSPVVGEAIVYRLNDGYHTRLGSDAIKWELSADGVSDWTAAPSSGSSLRSTGGTDYFVPKATEANQRLRNQVNTTESGWLVSYITPPIKASWTGATSALSFASGHNPPRVGQSIAISGSDKVWWMFCAAATTSDCVVGDTNKSRQTSYTPGASVQGKYLYAYRYYTDSNGILTKASTGFIGPIQAAASP